MIFIIRFLRLYGIKIMIFNIIFAAIVYLFICLECLMESRVLINLEMPCLRLYYNAIWALIPINIVLIPLLILRRFARYGEF